MFIASAPDAKSDQTFVPLYTTFSCNIVKIDSKIVYLSPSMIVKRSILIGQGSDNKMLCKKVTKLNGVP